MKKKTRQKELSKNPSLPLAEIRKTITRITKITKETRKHIRDIKGNQETNKPKLKQNKIIK